MEVKYNHTSKSLRIQTDKVRTYDELFDDLGDIVSANEVKQNYIAFEGMLYELNDRDCFNLMNIGIVCLPFIENVVDCGNKDFIKWYF
jgi:hypothetical protein